jgi:hypothetical protein
MRSFTFDVVEVMNDNGFCHTIEGSKWIKLANKMVSEGRATLVENSRSMTGSGTAFSSSHDVCYLRFNMTVTEKVN